jgi:type I restriction-modification system DNA methylase subunit
VDQATHNKIASFIWGIADDVLRDLFRRGKYPDVILPMCALRRMDAVLEPTKQASRDEIERAAQGRAGQVEGQGACAGVRGKGAGRRQPKTEARA